MHSADLIKILSNPVISQFIDYSKFIKSDIFDELVRGAIEHCQQHGDNSRVNQCLEAVKNSEYYRSCLEYFSENSILCFVIRSDSISTHIDRSKIPKGIPLRNYMETHLGTFSSVLEQAAAECKTQNVKKITRKKRYINKASRNRGDEPFNQAAVIISCRTSTMEPGKKSDCLEGKALSESKLIGRRKEQDTLREMANVLKNTSPEFRGSVYRDLDRNELNRKNEERVSAAKKLTDKIKFLTTRLHSVSGETERTQLLAEISRLKKEATKTKPLKRKLWSPILPGSYGSRG